MIPVTFLIVSALLVIGTLVLLARAKIGWLMRGLGMLCLMPTAWFTLFYAYVVRAYLALGYWPSPYHPDPKDLLFTSHHLAIWLSFPAVIVSIVICSLTLLRYARQHGQSRWLWASALSYLASVIIWLGVARIDPGQFLQWFAD